MTNLFQCRQLCGACCIAPSISSPIPNMPNGKPAGIPCSQLDENFNCRIFGSSSRPSVCSSLKPSYEMCVHCAKDALDYLTKLERLTSNDY